jgi:hypothetical protein
MLESCNNCRYAIELLGGELRCYRFPPNVEVVVMSPGQEISYEHVPVNPDDWCGEWKEKA